MSGAGTNSGINYQQRIAALTLVAQYTDFDLSNTFGINQRIGIETVHFETDDPIDDLKIKCKDCTIFLQIKRTLSFQVDKGTDFYGVVEQFINQFILNTNAVEYYILATSTNSSNTITQGLSKITESIRLNDNAFVENPLNKSETNTFDKFKSLFFELYLLKTRKKATDEGFIKFSKKIHISVIEIEAGRPNEQVAIILLTSKKLIDTLLVWNSLIANSLEYARKRQSVNKQAIENILKRYVVSSEVQPEEDDDLEKFFQIEVINNGSFPVAKEVIMVESIDDEHDYLIMELYRFSEEGKKKHEFSANKIKLEKIAEPFNVIQRAATFQGLDRFLEENQEKFKDKKIVIIPSNPEFEIKGDEKRPIAELHKKYLQELGAKNKNILKCLHCDKNVTIKNSTLVEIDDKDSKPSIGAVHNLCLRPIDRIIGKALSGSSKNNEFLLNFDYKTWAKLLMRGQGMMNGLKSAKNILERPKIVAWSANEKEFRDYSYCIKFTLEDDSIVYMTDRGRIHRFNKPEAEEAKNKMTDSVEHYKEMGDPICYTNKNFVFGNKSQLSELKNENETVLEIKTVEVSRYSKLLEKLDHDIFFYAPICIIRHFEEETLVSFNNSVPLISDPLNFENIFNSWSNIGFDLSIEEVELKIIKSDLEFDSYMREFFATGMVPIIDPKYDNAPNLISGITIRHREQMMAEHEEYRKPVKNPKWLKGDKVKLIIPTITDSNYPEGILLENEFQGEDNQLYVIFRPIEDGQEREDLGYAILSTMLEKND